MVPLSLLSLPLGFFIAVPLCAFVLRLGRRAGALDSKSAKLTCRMDALLAALAAAAAASLLPPPPKETIIETRQPVACAALTT